MLMPLRDREAQTYLGTGLHTLGLIGWILEQTGKANVYVSTFSTSEAFLNGFFNLKKKKLIDQAVLVADLKASRKTVELYRLMSVCFDSVFLSMNHSKVVLVWNENHAVTVISSQNQTYGDRAECTMVTTDGKCFSEVMEGLQKLCDNGNQLDGLFSRLAARSGKTGLSGDTAGDGGEPIRG